MTRPVIGACALFLATSVATAQHSTGTYFWTGPQDIGWFRTTVWPENPAGQRMPLYRYHTELTPFRRKTVALRALSFDVNQWIERRVPYDARSFPLPETRGLRTLQSGAISYILTHYTRQVEPVVLDYVATKGLAMWKLQNGSDGNPYMRSLADVDKVHLVDDHHLNAAANDLVRAAWGKTVVRRGDHLYLFRITRGPTSRIYAFVRPSRSRRRESRRFRLPGVRIDLAIVDPEGKASFSQTTKVTATTAHTDRYGRVLATVYRNGARKASVTATTTGVWGEVIAAAGESDFQTQIGDGPVLGKRTSLHRRVRLAPRRRHHRRHHRR